MNVNKKFDRLKQWGREKMGGEIKTDTSDEFKSLQEEMDLRHDGMERLKRSANVYIKWIGRRDQGDDKEKRLPVGFFGATMSKHGTEFEPDSEFGLCLSSLGRANERVARVQETYCANATNSWLESTERSLVQMKDYQDAHKRLEQRRLAYDTALRSMEKSKKEDFRLEEQLRSQKQKYEESSEEVYRRMVDIKEAEADSVADLTSLLDAELAYYDRCREVLLQAKKAWPASTLGGSRSGAASPINTLGRQETRSRASSLAERFVRPAEDDPLEQPDRPPMGARIRSEQISPRRLKPGADFAVRPPDDTRSVSGFEGPTSLGRDHSPVSTLRLSRVPTDPGTLTAALSRLRVSKREQNGNIFADDQSEYSDTMSQLSRVSHWSQQVHDGTAKKGPPPPPPPSRSKKPPPPPPSKRTAANSTATPQY